MGKRNEVERYVISSARHESKGRQAKGKQQKKEDVKQSSFCCDLQAKSPAVVEVTGFEPMASWSRTKRATNCATPRNSVLAKYSVFFDIAVDSTQARFRPASDALVDTLETAHRAVLLHA